MRRVRGHRGVRGAAHRRAARQSGPKARLSPSLAQARALWRLPTMPGTAPRRELIDAEPTMSPTTPPKTTRRRPIRYDGDRDLARVRTHGQANRPGADAYFALLTVPFWRFCAIVVVLVLLINTVFAWVYTLI